MNHLGERNTILNYYKLKNGDLKIEKKDEKLKVAIYKKIYYLILYDYDKKSDTHFLYTKEDNIFKFKVIKCNDKTKEKEEIFINIYNLLTDNSCVNTIKLIPAFDGFDNQNVLVIIDYVAHIIKIKNSNLIGKNIQLRECFKDFDFKEFDELQFIVDSEFLLILIFDNKSRKWIGKVFLLCLENESELLTLFETIEIISEKETKFSYSEMGGKKYLFGITIVKNSPNITYWEIDSQLSDSFITTKKKENEMKNIPIGNCIVNYIYHCFLKFPLFENIIYNIENEKKNLIKLSFYGESLEYENKNKLKKYIQNLLTNLKINKYGSDGAIEYIDKYQNFIGLNNSSIGYLLIKILEITPIQIAKIMENQFKIISNGENIELKVIKEMNKKKDDISIEEYSGLIQFSMKESIFNYFKLPVVVICCFGVQSIGKSTFLNELTGSLFDVSGGRCTEGIWMNVKLNIMQIKRDKKCFDLKIKNIKIKENENIRKNNICGKNCMFNIEGCKNIINNCNLKCYKEKGHENSLRCIEKDCICQCKCKCNCNKYNHNHKCFKCKKEEKECTCECDCIHLCEIEILNHNFICVCLDFEGLGSFERTNDQDIQMALIGSGIGNNIIFRTVNSFDRFTQSTLEKISHGSQRIIHIENNEFFGGSLILSPRDVNNDLEALKNEFSKKVNMSINKWLHENKKCDIKYNYFGIFSEYIFGPTPPIQKEQFYKTIRDTLIPEIIGNTFKDQRNPIFKTGKEFCIKLKKLLSAVYMNDYAYLSDVSKKDIKNYIDRNIDKALEVCGIYKKIEEYDPKIYLRTIKGFEYYFNNDYLEKLKISLIYENKLENDNLLIIDKIITKNKLNNIYNIG